MRGRKIGLALVSALMLLVLSGCMMSASVEELYSLPQLPEEYQALSDQIDAILAGGAEYTSPTAGTNLQSVQLEDLDGDGHEEAMAFFRMSSEERPMRIYIFRAVGDTYEQAAVIEGSGTAIHSVRYLDMDGDGVKEILVSWRASAEVQAMAVYVLDGMEPVLTMSAAYARYEVVDLDRDDYMEVVVLRSDETAAGGALADYYDWEGRSLTLRSSARLSVSVAELQWVDTGNLASGERAVLVTGRATGVEETSRAVTDILIYREPDLTNIALSGTTGVSSLIARFVNLQPTDINGDGFVDVPMSAELPTLNSDETYWKIYWICYDSSCQAADSVITYHNQADSWYLKIPESWDGHFAVQQSNSSATERATTFYAWNGGLLGQELFTIYTLTGGNRDTLASQNGREVLRWQANATYAVRYTDDYETWRYRVEPAQLQSGFNVILTPWSTGEE